MANPNYNVPGQGQDWMSQLNPSNYLGGSDPTSGVNKWLYTDAPTFAAGNDPFTHNQHGFWNNDSLGQSSGPSQGAHPSTSNATNTNAAVPPMTPPNVYNPFGPGTGNHGVPNPVAPPPIQQNWGNPGVGAQFQNPYNSGWAGFQGGQIKAPAGPSAAQLSFMNPNGQASANPFTDPFAQGQLGAMNNLQAMATGQPGTSLAEMQARQSGAQNIAGTYAMANSAHGVVNPAVTRTAMQQGAMQGAQTQQAAAQARMAEQLGAAGMLGTVAGQGRQQSFDAANANAGFQQQAGITGFNGGITAAVQQGSLDQDTAKTVYTAAQNAGINQLQADTAFQSLQQKYASMGYDTQRANQQAALDIQKLISAGALGRLDADAKAKAANDAMLGGLIGAGGTVAAAGISKKSDNPQQQTTNGGTNSGTNADPSQNNSTGTDEQWG